MGQLTIYLPDKAEKRLRQAAKRAKKSLSAYVVERLEPPKSPSRDVDKNGWPKDFLDVLGTWEGDFELPEDRPPRDPPSFD